jgi:hypothetical protein
MGYDTVTPTVHVGNALVSTSPSTDPNPCSPTTVRGEPNDVNDTGLRNTPPTALLRYVA